MVATRNKRKSSSPAASPATATRLSKRGKAAALDPPAEDDPAAVAVEPETTNSSSKSAPTATDADDVDVAATTTEDDVEANDSVALKSGGESEEVAADGIADVKVVPAETPMTDQPQQHDDEDDDCDADAPNNDNKAEADEADASAAAAAEEVVADVKKEEEGKKEESNVGVGDSATDHSHQQADQAADVAYVIDTSPDVAATAAATAAVDVVAKKEEKKEPTSSNAATANINDKVNKSNADKNADATSSKAPSSATTAPTTSTTNPTTTTATTTASSSSSTPILEETDQLLPLHVGRVIGKGGEMIRDLQARSGCLRIDVDQNVPQNAPRIISYRGTRSAIDFAKQLVLMLCKTEQGKEANLPLGHAVTKTVHVPSNVIGKIIGRGGEMIRKLQGESMAKIQVDHTTTTPSGDRLITITGVQESVARAEEMIQFVCANPALDSMQGLDMFLREKAQAQYQQQYYPGGGGGGGGGGGYPPFSHQQQLPPYPQGQFGGGGGGYPGGPPAAGPPINNPSMVETDMFPCAKTYMGRVIGQKGITINDLQKRSGCDIQINQNVPVGQDCQISIKGSRSGIEMAKQMLREIIEMGPNHPYAGGHGHVVGGGSFGPPGGGGGGFGGGGGYQQPYQAYPQQFTGCPNDNYPPQGHRPQQPFGNVPPHLQQQQQPYGQQPYLLTPQHLQQPQQQPPTYQQPEMVASPWRAASAPDGQIYYYNSITQETQWDRPAGMP